MASIESGPIPLPYARQHLDEADVAAVVAVLRGDWLTQGPAIPAFEAAMAALCQVPEAVAVSSATAGLHLACLAAGLGPEDRLWTVPNTFVSTANVGLLCGATVDFVDIDPDTGLIDLAALAEQLPRAAREGWLPKVLIPVHFAGQPVDMAALSRLTAPYGITLIEDAAHALGATDRGVPVGACAHSAMTVFSFHPVKIATTGEGGVVTTRDPALAAQLRRLRSHGIERDPAAFQQPAEGPWAYELQALGLHYRLTDIQAALGTSQLQRLPAFLARRRALADRYQSALAGWPVRPLLQRASTESAWHLFVVRLADGPTRRRVYDALHAAGIRVQVHYVPVHTQPLYQARGHRPEDCPAALAYAASCLSLPMFFGLSDAEQDRVVAVLTEALITPA